ncbi:siphovirus ReqiPepy6 Gp37-like family protein [Streptomyces sp. CBMA29]|uniref:siphovirus ReqiPepy6 Gp37-like family protein n=1 Tax=Streptomyces sp. CBMA29 TaxID=1896314 RepID=UPI00166214F2|nr:siphovirus ReqiPepy6 Gp37-like family protein [Streptomyces sp. CBMA29]MBD0739834.1 hypothetical protein [Streptomyces sp. CBMA29]
MGYRIEVRNRDLNRVGEVDTWISLDFTVAYCAQGSWQLLIKNNTPQAQLFEKGGGVAIYQDGVDTPVLTGACEVFQKYWTVEQHTNVGSVYISGHCDNKLAYSRLAFPDPAKPIATQWSSPTATRTVTGGSSTALWNEVNKAMGPGALPDRRAGGLVLDGAFPAGAPISDSLRYDVLGDKFADWIAKNPGTGYRFVYDPDARQINFRVFQPRDLTQQIRFSPELGNLREFVYSVTAPSVTRAIVACQGDGNARYIYQQVNTAIEQEWGLQAEAFVDRRDLGIVTSSTGTPVKADPTMTDADFNAAVQAVEDAASSALADGAPKGNLQIYPIDTPQVQFGRDYFVGDMVTAYIDGVAYSDVLRQVTISVDDGGKTLSVAPVIGDQGTGNPLNLYSVVSDMRDRVRKLETRG